MASLGKRAWGVATAAALAASATVPTAAGANSSRLTLDRSTGLLNGQLVTLTGSGFDPLAPGAALECSTAAGQPTVLINAQPTPVSCTTPNGSFFPLETPFALTDPNGGITA